MQEMAFKGIKGRRVALRIQCFIPGHSLIIQYLPEQHSQQKVSFPTQSFIKSYRALPTTAALICFRQNKLCGQSHGGLDWHRPANALTLNQLSTSQKSAGSLPARVHLGLLSSPSLHIYGQHEHNVREAVISLLKTSVPPIDLCVLPKCIMWEP